MCTCTKLRFPSAKSHFVRGLSKVPKLACVESLDARVISKFPFKPNRRKEVIPLEWTPSELE